MPLGSSLMVVIVLAVLAVAAEGSPSSSIPRGLDFAVYATGTGCGAINFSGNSFVDSFDSSQSTYVQTKENSNAAVGSNGNIILSGNVTIYGSLFALNTKVGPCSSGNDITLSGKANATGGYVQLATIPIFASVAILPPGTTNLSLMSNVSLPPGNYGNISLSGHAILTLSPGAYSINSLVLSGQSSVAINPPGAVVVNVAGDNVSSPIQFSGGTIDNPSGRASNFQLIYGGTQSISLSGGSNSHALVYAPNADVSLSGGSDWFGAFVVKSFNDSGNVALHFDRSLATPPTVSAQITPAPDQAGWNNSNVTVSFVCADPFVGIATCSSPTTLTNEGANQTVVGTATNRAGLAASTSVTVNIDKTAPSISGASMPPSNGAGWNNSNVTVSFSCSDALSGIASCSGPILVSSEGAMQPVTGTAVDKAGNTAAAIVSVSLDKTPPTLTIVSPTSGASVNPGSLTINGTVTDALSGVASVTCQGSTVTISNGTFSCTATIAAGANSIAVQALDLAGNITQTTLSVQGGIPTLTPTSPNTGQQGQQSLSVTLTGRFTHWVQGTTTASFGSGITVATLTVSSATSATAVLNISPTATIGATNVTLTTGTEVVMLTNGFTITALNQPPVVSAGPNQTIFLSVAPVTINGYPIPTNGSSLDKIAAGPDGNLWFDEHFGNKIGRITTAGAITEFPIPSNSNPNGITAGPDGNMWFAESSGNRIGRITTTGVITEFSITTGGSAPSAITAGPDGNVWFVERFGNNIGRITPSGVITEFPIPTVNSQPKGIAAGPDGNLWFTESGWVGSTYTGVTNIGRITTGGVITEFVVPTVKSQPEGITSGPDGNLWFTESVGNQIGRITPAGVITEFAVPAGNCGLAIGCLEDIATGPDGNLWFTATVPNEFGRITLSGVVTLYPLASGVSPVGITGGPDCNLWVTEGSGNNIERVVPGIVPVSTTLTGSILDDGLPVGATLTAAWSQSSGPAQVSLGTPSVSFPDLQGQSNSAVTSASFCRVGPYGITLTGSDSQLSNSATVTVTVNPPQIPVLSLSPNVGQQGQLNLSVTISGQSTHFVQGTTSADFGTGITVASLTVNSPTTATAVLNINSGATLGGRDVSLTTGNEIATLPSGFNVTSSGANITQVSPNVGSPGQQNLTVSISGIGTHFTQGSTQASFGAGVSVGGGPAGGFGNLTVNSATSATAILAIDRSASGGLRSITVTTGSEQVTLANGFTVNTNQPPVVTSSAGCDATMSLMPAQIMFSEYPVLTPSSFPQDIALGPDCNLWFTENHANKIGRITPTGVVTEFPIPTQNSYLIGITAGPDGNLWFTEAHGNQIGRITPAGIVTEFAVPVPNLQPLRITAGSDGNLWFGDSSATCGLGLVNYIGRISPTGVFTMFPLPTNDADPNGITVGPDGNYWFAESCGHKIGRITPAGAITEFPVPTANGNPVAITTGPDGNLWFVESSTNNVGRITTTGTITEFPSQGFLQSIVSAPDGNLWFAEYNNNNIGRITPSGVITEFSVPTSGSQPQWLTVAADGNIWFTEQNGNQIGKINPATGVVFATLAGSISDDGLPVGATLTGSWATTSGPSPVSFGSGVSSFPDVAGNSNSVFTSAIFSSPGTYTLKFSGSDSQLSSIATTIVTVIPASQGPTLVSANPNGGQQGQQSLSVVLSGQLTNWAQGTTTASFGAGISIASLTISSSTSATVVVNIDPAAATGTRDVTLTTGTEVDTLTGGFTVTGAAVVPTITQVSPSSGQQGQGGPVGIAGQNTHFAQGTTQVSFGAGIAVSNINVTCPTCLTAQLQIDPAATPGPRTVTVTTGTEVASLANGFTVQPGTPFITSFGPTSGQQGQTLPITINGQFSHFAQGITQISLGVGITVSNINVSSATSLTAQAAIDPAAALGTRSLTVTTGTEVVSVPNVFTVQAATPVIFSLNPGGGQQGQQNLGVTIMGLSTHWVQGVTTASFGGGVTVVSLAITSATSAVATVNIDPAAAVGARTVTLSTNTEVSSFMNGFTISAPTPIVLSLDPGGAQQGQQSLSVAVAGLNTHWVQGTSQASFGVGVTVSSFAVSSPTTATAVVNIDPAALVGPRTVTVSTNSEIASFSNGFTIVAGTPAISLVNPNTGQAGQQTLSVALTGQFSHWVQGTTTASFGSNITISSLTVVSATAATAVINIDPAATAGSRTVTLTTGSEIVTLTNGFTVGTTASPTLTQLNPTSGQQSQQNLLVTITGQATHFAQGTTQASFGGAGITVNSVAVASATSLTANISIASNTATGRRTVTVTTGSEVASIPNGFAINTGTNQAPVITIAPSWTDTLPNSVTITYAVTDDGLPSGGVLTVSWQTISGPGTVQFQNQTPTSISAGFSQAGTYVLQIAADDSQLSTTQNVTVTVTGTAIPPPVVSITSPADGTEVTTVANVIGSVGSAALSNWVLEYQPPNDSNFHTLATGNTAVTNGSLGTFDPTLLVNGIAHIRLTATDTSNQSTTTGPISLVLTRNQKVGNFTVSFNDLSVPVAGLPIQIVRTYDSRNRFVSEPDFSYGWSLGINAARLAESVTLGNQWTETSTGGAFPNYCVQQVQAHMVTVTLQDGTTYQFAPTLNPSCQSLVPIQDSQVTITFSPTGATPPNAALSIVGNNQPFVVGSVPGPVTLTDSDFITAYDPDQYLLTLPDGRTLQISMQLGLQKFTDLNGNTLTVSPTGVMSSSGKGVTFTRNAAKLITQITDPAGHSINYSYDPLSGNLTSVTDQNGNTTTFTYDTNHFLLTIVDPRGVQPIKNVYDSSGRLIQHIDAFGNVINYTNNLSANQEVVTDRLGNVTINNYDADGNIVRVTDALGGVTNRTYDARDNLLTETNALNETRTYTYDANNNRLTETDPLGNITTYTYNARNQVLTITDALGRVTTNTYDTAGNLLSTKDAAGNTTTYVYNSQGLRTSMTDSLGDVTSYQYDSFGDLTQQTDALGNVTTYTYDANGNKLSEMKTRTTTGGPDTLLTSYKYDAQSRVTQTTYSDGSTTQIAYNSIGKQGTTTDQLGHQTSYTYDLMGRLTQTTYADGTTEISAYDAEGDRITSTDRGGRMTTYVYDPLKRLTKTTYADGANTSTAYNAISEVTGVTDARSNTTQYQYDAAGRRTKVIDALTHSTSFSYDRIGNQTSMTDANGNTTQYQYDALNRRTTTVYPDLTTDAVAYDALGQTTGKTDQAGKTTQFQYDKLGRLTQVTDAASQITKYAYDEVGDRISQTDANGHVTTFAYDRLGRRIMRTLPLGMSETLGYDAAGNLISKIDFNGKRTTYAFDLNNRLTTKTPDPSFSASSVGFTYTSTGQRQNMVDASGTTTYAYDLRDRLLSKATPEGTLTYTYDLAGNLNTIRSSNVNGTSANYAFDALNRLSTVMDNRLSVGTTSYNYDNAGNLATYAYPNGLQHSYTYNSLNRLTNVAVGKGATTLASYGYTLGPAGNRTAVAELGGRNVTYTYDSLYRLTNETIAGGSLNGSLGYTYDAVGNRLSRTSTVSAVPPTTSTYDADDRLASDTYDSDGNTTASSGNTYAYDFENHLTTENSGAVSIVYDGDGNRVSKTVSGTATKYLVDDRNLTGYAQVLEETSGGTVQRVYTYGLHRISQSQASGTSFYGYDGHGNVRLLTDTTGAVTDRFDYDVFGSIISQVGTTPNVYLFSGEQNDPNLGFYYLRARFFNAGAGRFLTMDTADAGRFDPSSLHRYVYAANNPGNRIDPSGLITIQEEIATVSIIDILATYPVATSALNRFSTAAVSGQGVFDGVLMSLRGSVSGGGGTANAGFDIAYDRRSKNWCAAPVFELGLDPTSLFKTAKPFGTSLALGFYTSATDFCSGSSGSPFGFSTTFPAALIPLLPSALSQQYPFWGTVTQLAKVANTSGLGKLSVSLGISGASNASFQFSSFGFSTTFTDGGDPVTLSQLTQSVGPATATLLNYVVGSVGNIIVGFGNTYANVVSNAPSLFALPLFIP